MPRSTKEGLEMHHRCILSPLPRLKKGPNNTPGVIWAITVHVFFISFRYFFSLTDIFSLYLNDKQPTFSQIAYLTSPLPRFKKGPNDTPGVVWAIIVRVFIISLRYFFSLTGIFSLYLVYLAFISTMNSQHSRRFPTLHVCRTCYV